MTAPGDALTDSVVAAIVSDQLDDVYAFDDRGYEYYLTAKPIAEAGATSFRLKVSGDKWRGRYEVSVRRTS